ncbi:MAG: MCE family protein [Solirubrobacterales bacterium]|nr:MCE family protein [Solirubrobacterales bacterium]MBV9796933.1 MCE family protein [Solirubrobacterales bacterium]
MRKSTVIGRVAAVATLAVVLVAVVVIILSSGSSYQVQAIFVNASQIVTGDQVQVAGNPIGSVSGISLTPEGQAKLTLSISNSTFSPLHEGTVATVRQASLSGIANRYVDLRLGPATAPAIPDNGTLGTEDTTSAVDLDQLFNTLDPATVKGLQNVIQGSASQYADRGRQAQAGWAYLNPAIVASRALFSEINRDTGNFTNFIVNSSDLVSTLSQRSADLSGLVANLSQTTQALAAQRTALGQSIQRLPGFMGLAITTFRNLNHALAVLTPLVNVAKPVAPKLQQLLVQLRPLAQDAVPTVRALSQLISSPGQNNDLIDLTRLGVPLADATVRNTYANGKVRAGAFPESTLALRDFIPELATARPYAVDLTGWFEGFSHPGTIDANGGASRVAATLGVLSAADSSLVSSLPLAQQITKVIQLLTGPGGGLTAFQGDRCPGSIERGALFFPGSGFPCNPSEVPTGP